MIKPDNILISTNKTAVICDLGSAKQFGSGIVHTSYVCTRWYRAPELILSATKYDGAVDIWACGCVIIELICKKVAFKAVDSIGQLCCIFKSLGIPTENDIYEFNDELDPLIIKRVQKQHAHVGLRKCVQRLLCPQTTHTNSNLRTYMWLPSVFPIKTKQICGVPFQKIKHKKTKHKNIKDIAQDT